MRISDWSSDVCSSDLVGRRQWAEDPLRILEPEQFALDGRGPFFAAVCQSIPDTGVQQHDMASRQGLDQLAIHLERMSPRPFMPEETKFRPHDSPADGITLSVALTPTAVNLAINNVCRSESPRNLTGQTPPILRAHD